MFLFSRFGDLGGVGGFGGGGICSISLRNLSLCLLELGLGSLPHEFGMDQIAVLGLAVYAGREGDDPIRRSDCHALADVAVHAVGLKDLVQEFSVDLGIFPVEDDHQVVVGVWPGGKDVIDADLVRRVDVAVARFVEEVCIFEPVERREHGVAVVHVVAVDHGVAVFEVFPVDVLGEDAAGDGDVPVKVMVQVVFGVGRMLGDRVVDLVILDADPCIEVRVNCMKLVEVDRIAAAGKDVGGEFCLLAFAGAGEFLGLDFLDREGGIVLEGRGGRGCDDRDLGGRLFVCFPGLLILVEVPGDEAEAGDEAEQGEDEDDVPAFLVHVWGLLSDWGRVVEVDYYYRIVGVRKHGAIRNRLLATLSYYLGYHKMGEGARWGGEWLSGTVP